MLKDKFSDMLTETLNKTSQKGGNEHLSLNALKTNMFN